MSDPSEEPLCLSLPDTLEKAEGLKAAANQHFQAARYDEAIASYLDALAALPPRPTPVLQDHDEARAEEADNEPSSSSSSSRGKQPQPDAQGSAAPAEPQALRQLRAALHANLAASYLKTEQYDEAIASASDALAIQPDYVKALHRRASANIELGTLPSLSSALEDQKRLLTLPHLPPSSRQPLQTSIAQLEPRVQSLAEKEKDEMLAKLKGIGDSLLGTFGLSTNNFKFTKQDKGGYSMNFVR